MLAFTRKHTKIQQQVEKFAREEVTPFVEKMEEGVFPRPLVEKMGKQGFMGIPFSKRYGGLGLDFISYIIAIHEISKKSAALGVILSVHTSVCTNPILTFGTEKQRERYVKRLASGDILGAFALTETGAGSDAGSLKTKAEKDGDVYILNGAKQFITNGGEADIYLVFARTDKGITAFIVDKETVGLKVGKDEKKMGLHGSRTTPLYFENMKVHKEHRLGDEGEGFKIAMSNLNIGRIGIAAQALGIAEASLEEALFFIKRDKKSLLPLANMATRIEGAKLLTYQAAFLKQKGKPCRKEASMAKLFAAKTAVYVTSGVLDCLAEYRGIPNHHAERFFRDAKVCEIYEGTSEIQKIVISRSL
ncbi:acyl-CoA dehydrogenase family protein [Priestia filamentosa]|uniref:Acyl-CoA dehydrogenase n=1 Tax=Priestia filamentosa TaxID=1402861 RepID=A0A0H4KPI1_9BACI|nr:acyl-CoA dehydrogenase family protein [Priestia filamentosa]AKO94806.1 acyl-CoA dehydrogenase [Priestia filamentosa]MDT3765140.1 acyl-CoA dehydrogenase family protein [Priestia filamentosa]RJS66072.1 acyl-CoA dehydrogenase [Priestia filamentosa]WCM15724.1 acyl-CoA dehydrogenase family protein [Priestia filamentosa]WRU95437.1 acyl-CoA dehydrogenase family protein [Priestia filamentosa]